MWWTGAYGRDLEGTARGIAILDSRADGSLQYRTLAVEADSPSYLIEGNGQVYAANEGTGQLTAFRRVGDSLVPDSSAPSGGTLPCHLSLLAGALIVANYGSGTLVVVGIGDDGALGLVRQSLDSPSDIGHAHASLALDNSRVLSADLGADRVFVHEFDGQRLRRSGEVPLPAGSGPRDLALHPSGVVYVVGELDGTVTVLEVGDGMPQLVASVGLPGFMPGDHAAAISFGPGGYLYSGLRGSNRISVLRAAADGRTVTAVGWVPSEGEWPRHLVVDGEVLHVANQMSNTVASFRLGPDGMPALIRQPEPVASPTFLMKAL